MLWQVQREDMCLTFKELSHLAAEYGKACLKLRLSQFYLTFCVYQAHILNLYFPKTKLRLKLYQEIRDSVSTDLNYGCKSLHLFISEQINARIPESLPYW